VDPAGVTMLDSIKVYGKTKEQFGWPEEPPEDFSSSTSVNNVCSPNLNQGNGAAEGDVATPTAASGTVLERYASGAFCRGRWPRFKYTPTVLSIDVFNIIVSSKSVSKLLSPVCVILMFIFEYCVVV